MLASVNREGELLDGKADSQRSRNTDRPDDELLSDEELPEDDTEPADDESAEEQVSTNVG